MSFWPCQRRLKITCIVRAKWLWGTYSCCQGRIHSALVAQKLMSLIACHDTEADCLPCAIWPFLVNGPAYMINVASWTFGTLLFSVLKVTRSFEGQKKLFIICCHVQVSCNHHLHRDCQNLRDWVNLLSLAIRLSEPPLLSCHLHWNLWICGLLACNVCCAALSSQVTNCQCGHILLNNRLNNQTSAKEAPITQICGNEMSSDSSIVAV